MNKKKLLRLLPAFIGNGITARGFSKNRYYRRIPELDIRASGISIDGFPYVTLNTGLTFFSYFPTSAQKVYYKQYLPDSMKAKLHIDCIGVARDIVMRYLGPASKKEHFPEGKYYDLNIGDTVVEIGAYIGYYAMRAAEIISPKGQVIAIEAIDENFHLMQKNIQANNIKNIIPIHKASHNTTGKLEFFRESNQIASAVQIGINTKQKLIVPCDTLDNILNESNIDKVDFIRIQVNGAELDVLKGMTNTLKSKPKLMVAAIYKIQGRPAWQDIVPVIRDMGYKTRVDKGNIFAYT
ncbi:FkbM family methyltransferase [candidate division KSB1 bacterium]|nr:FkbM family methyltransferase [candidate division KSB1 bacterium]